MAVLANASNNNNRKFNWGRFSKTLAFWILIMFIPVALIQLSSSRADQIPQVIYSQYDQELQHDNVKRVVIQAGRQVTGEFKHGVAVNGKEATKFTVKLPVENSD